MNTPNKLTLFRIMMFIPFITFMSISFSQGKSPSIYHLEGTESWTFFVSGFIFLIAMITDYADGYLARKNNQVTTFGKLFDPLADKIMTTSAMIMLSLMGIVPFYLTIIFVLRDVLVDGFRNLSATKKIDVSASMYGKAKTMVQSIGIILIFFIYIIFSDEFGVFEPIKGSYKLFLLDLPIFVATLLSVISGALYFNQVRPYIKTK